MIDITILQDRTKEQFKKLKEQQGISRAEACRLSDVSEDIIKSMFSKKATVPNVLSVAKLADYFGVSIDYLIGIIDTPQPVKEQPLPDFPERAAKALIKDILIQFKDKTPLEQASLISLALKGAFESDDFSTSSAQSCISRNFPDLN